MFKVRVGAHQFGEQDQSVASGQELRIHRLNWTKRRKEVGIALPLRPTRIGISLSVLPKGADRLCS